MRFEEVVMAKLGEGDPRWIVAERDDGRNVGGWHWQDENCLAWAKEWFEERTQGCRVAGLWDGGGSGDGDGEGDGDGDGGEARGVRLTGVSEVRGDCSIQTRKGNKVLRLFDFESITVTFAGRSGEEGCKECKGKVVVTQFEAEFPEDVEVVASCDGSDADAKALAGHMRSKGVALVKQVLDEFRKAFDAKGPREPASPKAPS